MRLRVGSIEHEMRSVFGALLVVITACTSNGSTATTSVSEATTTTVSASASTADQPDASAVVDLPPAPWTEQPLDPETVEPLLLDAWHEAANHQECPLLSPVTLGPEGETATARRAGFEPDLEWFVAWDNPEGPGMTGNSGACEDCGRSAFGIHGSSSIADAAEPQWDDGSSVTVHTQDFVAYEDGHHRELAVISVTGHPCSYEVWSSLGEDHLSWFVDQLRYVIDHP